MFTNIKYTETVKKLLLSRDGYRFRQGSEVTAGFGASFKKIQNYVYKMRYESGYLFRKRKGITTNYKLKKKREKYHQLYKIQKKKTYIFIN